MSPLCFCVAAYINVSSGKIPLNLYTGIRDAILAAVGCSLAARENL